VASLVLVALSGSALFGCGGDESAITPEGAAAGPRSRVEAVAAEREDPAERFCDVSAPLGQGAALVLPQVEGPAMPSSGWRWVNVWATWCAPCVEEMPRIVAWRERLAADEAARADAERQRRALEQEQADRVAICARVEGLAGDDITDGVAQARAAWEGMPAMPEAWATELDRRFAEACRAAEKRFERRQLAKQSAEPLQMLVPEIETLAENPSDSGTPRQWYSVRQRCRANARSSAPRPKGRSRPPNAAKPDPRGRAPAKAARPTALTA
jgi:thiol-disulfide isomerase/thioredoxin